MTFHRQNFVLHPRFYQGKISISDYEFTVVDVVGRREVAEAVQKKRSPAFREPDDGARKIGIGRASALPAPIPAPGFPITVKVGDSPGPIELKGWTVAGEPGSPDHVSVICGTLRGRDCVGVCGQNLTPPVIATSLNRMTFFPKLIPQLQTETNSAQVKGLQEVCKVIQHNRAMVESMIETRMREFFAFPSEEKTLVLTHFMTALNAAAGDENDYGGLIHARESLCRVSTLILGASRTRDILRGSGAPVRTPFVEVPPAKRAKLDDFPSISQPRKRVSEAADEATPSPVRGLQPIPVSPPSIMPSSPLRRAWSKRVDDKAANAPWLAALTTQGARATKLPPKDNLTKLQSSIVLMLENPVMRKLFYTDKHENVLRLRMDLVATYSRKLAFEVVFPNTADPLTWRAKILGGYLPDNTVRAPPEQITALDIVDKGARIETSYVALDKASQWTCNVGWKNLIGAEIPFDEKEMTAFDLIQATAKLPGQSFDRPGDPTSIAKLSPLRLLQVARHKVRVTFKMLESDRCAESEPLQHYHSVGSCKSYSIDMSGSPPTNTMEMADMERLSATFGSRFRFIQMLAGAVQQSQRPGRDEPNGMDDFETATDSLMLGKTQEVQI